METISRESRSVMCDRLQVGSARTSCSREVDIAEKVISFDGYNQSIVRGGGKDIE